MIPLRKLGEAWDRFFFEPVSPVPLAAFRILFGLLLLANSALLAPDLLVWFGESGPLPGEIARQAVGGLRIDLFRLLPMADGTAIALFAALNVALLGLTAGFATRLCSVAVFLLLTSFHHRNPFILNSADTFLRVASFFLMFAPAGAALSVDRVMRIRKGLEKPGEIAPRSPWAQRLIQLQLSVLYVATALYKAKGATWIEGTAVYYVFNLQEFQRVRLPALFFTAWASKFLSWSTLVIEGSIGTLIWVRELRYPVLLAGIGLHLGIELTMNIPLFEWTMIAAYALFVDAEHYAWAHRRLREWLGRRWPALGMPAAQAAGDAGPVLEAEPRNKKKRRAG